MILRKLFLSFMFGLLLAMTSCTSYKTVPYLQNSSTVNYDSSEVLYDARIMPKDELSITVSFPEDPTVAQTFNLLVMGTMDRGDNSFSSTSALQTFLVTNEGSINFPVLGILKVKGLTTNELENLIASRIEGSYLKARPIVTVRLSNYKISVLGEVTTPGTYSVPSEKISIYDALAKAGDLTIWGRRDNVKLIREDVNGKKSVHELDLNDANLINSPYYYLQQNDVIYVTPNKTKSKNSDIGTSTSYWVSSISILVSIASLVTNILR